MMNHSIFKPIQTKERLVIWFSNKDFGSFSQNSRTPTFLLEDKLSSFQQPNDFLKKLILLNNIYKYWMI